MARLNFQLDISYVLRWGCRYRHPYFKKKDMQSVTIKSKPLFLELCRLYQFKSYRKRHPLMREWGYKYFSSDTHEAVCFVYDEKGRVHYKIELENLIINFYNKKGQ